jgi:GNAT superfamily N-acetyltransferase
MGDTTMTLRRGTVEDARQVADHNIAMALETESLALDDATCLAGCKSILGDSSKGFYTVAVEDGRVVGQLMITYEWSDWRNRTTWWIQSVYVVPDRRGRGIFKALYSHVRALCEEEGGAGLRLYADNSNVKAQAVYGKLGMVRVCHRRAPVLFSSSLSPYHGLLSPFQTSHYLVFEDMLLF